MMLYLTTVLVTLTDFKMDFNGTILAISLTFFILTGVETVGLMVLPKQATVLSLVMQVKKTVCLMVVPYVIHMKADDSKALEGMHWIV